MKKMIREYKGLGICAIVRYLPKEWKPTKLVDKRGAYVGVYFSEERNSLMLYKVTTETMPVEIPITAVEFEKMKSRLR